MLQEEPCILPPCSQFCSEGFFFLWHEVVDCAPSPDQNCAFAHRAPQLAQVGLHVLELLESDWHLALHHCFDRLHLVDDP
eukprot:15610159-Heterocapsa_arctica.AAC.1